MSYAEDKVNSNESEGAFNEFIDDQLDSIIDHILNDGDLNSFGDRDSEVIVEIDDISPPRFTYNDTGGQAGGKGNQGPGEDSEKIRFSLPMQKLMELISRKLGLPNLNKEGDGRIKEISYEFKTFGTAGVILDKKRTFKKTLKTNIGMGFYDPANQKYDLQFRRRDRRYKLPERVENPKYKAVVFYMGDISYSTYGERLELEKRVVNFIHNWLDYNYGSENVNHRFFVHDASAYEVLADDFYKVHNAGGTRASVVFDLISQIAFNEYNPETTNFYGFYFGDGELFSTDADDIAQIMQEQLCPIFNRIGIVEVKPSNISKLVSTLEDTLGHNSILRLAKLDKTADIVKTIKTLFGES
ncbi:DUF444 family protein [bacterium AH-315-E10]|nr:DUF444 family protein [bacterium AH-315-E10]